LQVFAVLQVFKFFAVFLRCFAVFFWVSNKKRLVLTSLVSTDWSKKKLEKKNKWRKEKEEGVFFQRSERVYRIFSNFQIFKFLFLVLTLERLAVDVRRVIFLFELKVTKKITLRIQQQALSLHRRLLLRYRTQKTNYLQLPST